MRCCGRPESDHSGFTILEIMISVAILTVGLMGILALFPVAIETSRVTIQDTNSVLIAQSVEQAIREGIQHRKGQTESGEWTYFIFQHEGVLDPVPRRIQDADPGADYFILFPDSDLDKTSATSRESAFGTAKTFVYPETDGKTWITPDGEEDSEESNHAPNGGGKGDPRRADDDSDDRSLSVSEEDFDGDPEEGQLLTNTFEVFHTYRLGQVTEEELEDESDLQMEKTADPLSTYSYAFAIRRSFDDANLLESTKRGSFAPMGELYQVTIMVFRSFRRGTSNADPIYRSTILVHK